MFWGVFVLAINNIDINSATIEELDQIIGIGPVLAQRIINARPFYSINDLLKVKGIGEKTFQKIKDQGLAYVIKTQEPEKSPTLIPAPIPPLNTLPNDKKTDNTYLSAVSQTNSPNPWLLFLMVLIVSITLGAIIIILKIYYLKNNLS